MKALLPLFLALSVAAYAADLPPPRAMPSTPVNLTAGGPPIPSNPPAESAHPASLPLWSNGAPGSEARKDEPENISWRQERDIVFPVISNIHNPSLTPFIPAKNKATGCAVIIAPGGGNMQLTIDREGYDLARWLAERGIAAFVLKNRLARDGSTPAGTPQPYKAAVHSLADAQRAMRTVRSRATEWGIDPARVGFIGFSAGGEVLGHLLINESKGDAAAADPIERLDARPDFAGHVYSSFLRNFLTETATDSVKMEKLKSFPPSFLLCASNDSQGVVEFLPAFFVALKRAGVPAELHVYNEGGHGFGVREWPLSIGNWPVLFHGWLGDRGFLKKP
ncbi:MAG TPA: alpha/beta hydrolase [Opitutaceae bacterium]|nr:alpha/beta hydrolase [Opitutaceae bacterium]